MLKYFFLLLSSVFLVGCGGGGAALGPDAPGGVGGGPNPVVQLTTSAPGSLTLQLGELRTIQVIGGRAPYFVSVSNSSVVRAALENAVLSVGAVSSGQSNVRITDSLGATSTFAVSVPITPLFTSAPSAVTIGVGANPSYMIRGGAGPYLATSNNTAVATVGVAGNTLTITGVAPGTANVVVQDNSNPVGNVNIQVTIVPANGVALFTTAPQSVTLATGPANAQSFVVGGGVAPYTAVSSNNSVVTVNLVGTTLTLIGQNPGEATVRLRDNVGFNVDISVSVAVTPTIALFTTAPSNIFVALNDPQTYSIGGGLAPYTVTSNDTRTVSVGQTGSTFTVTGVNVGSANLRVMDAVGETVSIAVNVSQPTDVMQLLPSLFTISEGSSNPIVLNIFGGSAGADYRVFTSNQVLSSVSVTGNQLTIGLGTSGTRCVSGADPGYVGDVPPPYVPVTITVIDQFGTSATSEMRIEDNGTCP